MLVAASSLRPMSDAGVVARGLAFSLVPVARRSQSLARRPVGLSVGRSRGGRSVPRPLAPLVPRSLGGSLRRQPAPFAHRSVCRLSVAWPIGRSADPFSHAVAAVQGRLGLGGSATSLAATTLS